MKKHSLILSFILSFVAANIFSQTSWQDYYTINSEIEKKKPYINIDYNGFFKNNEYFSKLKEGQTFIGFNTNIGFEYKNSEKLKIEAGITYLNFFGEMSLKPIIPYFTIETKLTENLELIFGRIDGHHSHKLIEPLYSYDNYINHFSENGVQFKYASEIISSDTYLDWMKFIDYDSPFQEEILVGSINKVRLFKKSNHNVYLPFQITAYHKGGQINNVLAPIQTLINSAIGINYTFINNEASLESMSLNAMILTFDDISPGKQLAFDKGYSYYFNSEFRFYGFELEAAYYIADNFYSPLGEELYFNYSDLTKNHINKQRELIIAKVRYIKQLDDNFNLILHLNAYKDIEAKVDYFFALDFVYNLKYKL